MTDFKKEGKDLPKTEFEKQLEAAVLGDNASAKQVKSLLRVGSQRGKPLLAEQLAIIGGNFLPRIMKEIASEEGRLDLVNKTLALPSTTIPIQKLNQFKKEREDNIEELRGAARLASLAIVQNYKQLGAQAPGLIGQWLNPEMIEQIGLPTLQPEGDKHKERQVVDAGFHYGYWESMLKSQDLRIVDTALNIIMQLAVQGHHTPTGLIAMAEHQKIRTSFEKSSFFPNDYGKYRESHLQEENFKWDVVLRSLKRSEDLATKPFKTSTLDKRAEGINYLTNQETAKELSKIFSEIYKIHPYSTVVVSNLQLLQRRMTGENSDFITQSLEQKVVKPAASSPLVQSYNAHGLFGVATGASAAGQPTQSKPGPATEEEEGPSTPKPSGSGGTPSADS